MTESNQNILESMNFKRLEISWVGKVKRFYFYIEDKQDSENELALSFPFAPNENKSKLVAFLDECQTNSIVKNYSLDDSKIAINFIESETNDLKKFLSDLADLLESIELKCKCDNCSNTDFLNFYTNKRTAMLLCPTCAEKTLKSLEEDKSKAGNYVRGFFLSLVGALIGSAVWIILGALGFYASIAGFAISYCAFKGYEMAKGKMSRKGIILNVVVIAIVFLFAQYMTVFVTLRKEISELTFFLYIIATPALYGNKEFLLALLPDMGLGLLFVVLGTYRTIISNYKQAKNFDQLVIEKVEL